MNKYILSFSIFNLLLSISCSHLIYHPTRQLYVDPKKLKPSPETISYQDPDGLVFYGWHFKSPENNNSSCLIYFHGNGQNRSAHFLTLEWLVHEGIDYYIFDYPGYGQTAGQPTPESTVKMAKFLIKQLSNSSSCSQLFIYGHSLGGQIAMRAVWELREEFKPDLLIVDSSFLSYRKTARHILNESPWTWAFQWLPYLLFSDSWAIQDKLKDLKGFPLIVIHTKTDEIISLELGLEVYASANEPKELWLKEKGSHNAIYEDEEGLLLRKRLVNRLKQSLKYKPR